MKKSTRWQHHSENEIDALVARFDDLSLPKREWTHFAHLTVGFCSLERFGLEASRRLMPDRIRRYNAASGTPNTDSGGYPDTITMVFLAAVTRFRALLLGGGAPRLDQPADRRRARGEGYAARLLLARAPHVGRGATALHRA
jgi:hypothetical protein